LNNENYMKNKQLDIEFFWPLTEQIPLDLDYTDCIKPQYTTATSGLFNFINVINTNTSWTTATVGASRLVIDFESAVFKLAEEPPLYRKVLYKLMNIRWEKK